MPAEMQRIHDALELSEFLKEENQEYAASFEAARQLLEKEQELTATLKRDNLSLQSANEEEVRKLKETERHFQVEVEKLRHQLAHVEVSCSQRNEETAALAQIQAFNNYERTSAKKWHAYNTEFDDYRKTLVKLKQENELLIAEHDEESRMAKLRLEALHGGHQLQVDQLLDQISNLQQQLDNALREKAVSKWRSDFNGLEVKYLQLLDENDGLRKKLQVSPHSHDGDFKALNKQVFNLESALKSSANQLDTLREENTLCKEQLRSFTTANAHLVKESASLQAQVEHMTTFTNELKAQHRNELLNLQALSLQKENEQKDEIHVLRKDLIALRRREKLQDERIVELQAKISAAEHDAVQKTFLAETDAASKIKTLETECLTLTNKLTDFQCDCQSNERLEITRELQKELGLARIENQQKSLESLKSQVLLEQMSDRCLEKEKQLCVSQNRILELERACADFTSKNSALLAQKTKICSDLTAQKSSLSKHVSEFNFVKSRFRTVLESQFLKHGILQKSLVQRLNQFFLKISKLQKKHVDLASVYTKEHAAMGAALETSKAQLALVKQEFFSLKKDLESERRLADSREKEQASRRALFIATLKKENLPIVSSLS